MQIIRSKTRLLLQQGYLVKVVFLVCSLFFTIARAELPNTIGKTSVSRDKERYLLEVDRLDKSGNSVYVEKEDSDVQWVFFPIRSSMTDYYRVVASVVASELHRRIDKDAIVPSVKFLVKKGDDGYQVLGSVYKKIVTNRPILDVMDEGSLDDYNNAVYQQNHNIERSKAMWNLLGLSSPDSTVFELSEDNKLVRYDYYNALSYTGKNENYKRCFCTSYYPLSEYDCKIDRIDKFENQFRKQYKKTVEEVVSQIKGDIWEDLEATSQEHVGIALIKLIN